MQACSEDIKDMLVAESELGFIFGANLYIGGLPTIRGSIVSIIDTSGLPTPVTLDKKNYYYDSIQILSRASDYTIAFNLLQDIMLSLHSRAGEIWNDTYYSIITCTTKPALLLKDNNGDFIFTSNFNIQRR